MLKTHLISKKVNRQAAKLMYRWCGPYIIDQWTSPVNVKLKDPISSVFRRAHVSQLKKAHVNE